MSQTGLNPNLDISGKIAHWHIERIEIHISKSGISNYFGRIILRMSDDEDLSAFLKRFGISHEELNNVAIELDAYRSIPGTTLKRYLNRVLNSIIEEERPAFLKGIMVGVAIRKAVDQVEEPHLTDEEKKIAFEIEKQRTRL